MIIDHHRIKPRGFASVQDSLAPVLTSPVVSVRDKATLTPAAATLSATLSESLKFEIENVAAVSETTDASLTAPNVTLLDPATLTPSASTSASNLGVTYSESVDFDLENVAAVSETTGASLTAPDVTVLSPSTLKPAASNLGVSLSESADFGVCGRGRRADRERLRNHRCLAHRPERHGHRPAPDTAFRKQP